MTTITAVKDRHGTPIGVGDKVLIAVRDDTAFVPDMYDTVGQVSTIESVDISGYVRLENGWYYLSEISLEAVRTESAEPEFKVGDRVRVVKAVGIGADVSGRFVGQTGEVRVVRQRYFSNEGKDGYEVKLDHSDACLMFFGEELTLLPPAPKFKVGDIVRVSEPFYSEEWGLYPARVEIVWNKDQPGDPQMYSIKTLNYGLGAFSEECLEPYQSAPAQSQEWVPTGEEMHLRECVRGDEVAWFPVTAE